MEWQEGGRVVLSEAGDEIGVRGEAFMQGSLVVCCVLKSGSSAAEAYQSTLPGGSADRCLLHFKPQQAPTVGPCAPPFFFEVPLSAMSAGTGYENHSSPVGHSGCSQLSHLHATRLGDLLRPDCLQQWINWSHVQPAADTELPSRARQRLLLVD